MNIIPTPAPGEILIHRVFNAPVELVWQAWSDPSHLSRWHAPEGCEISFTRFDFRTGGGFHSCISNPAFRECWCVAQYLDIILNSLICYKISIADSTGNLVSSADAGHDPEWPEETIVTLTFTPLAEGKTQLTLHQNTQETLARRTGAYPSWLSMLDRLAETLNQLS